MGVSVSRMIASVRTVATNETAALGPDRLRQFLALSRLHSDGWGTAWTDPQSGEVVDVRTVFWNGAPSDDPDAYPDGIVEAVDEVRYSRD